MSTEKLSPQKNSNSTETSVGRLLMAHHAFRVSVGDGVHAHESMELYKRALGTEYVCVHASFYEYATFGIEDVRSVRDSLSLRFGSVKGDRESALIVGVFFYRITIDAQNALLKVLEEPPPNIRIVLYTPHIELLLPTIISRTIELQIIESESSPEVAGCCRVETPYLVRFQEIERCISGEQSNNYGAYIQDVQGSLHAAYLSELLTSAEYADRAEQLCRIERILQSGLGNMKPLLESAMLLVPYKK
jgi:DNA polymerase III, delta subunit